MAYWLMKSEPFVYSWAQLVKDGKNNWDGVRNHLAKRHLMSMHIGDEAFFYHSNEGLEIVGVMRISKLAHPDPSDITGKFVQVGVVPVAPFPHPVSLRAIKAEPRLAAMSLVNQSRLSVQPVTTAEWKVVCKMGGYLAK
jgi:predicted RNA-binding protein with PUA-like domain